MTEISIENNIKEIEDELSRLGLFIPNISKKILKRIASKGKSKLQKSYKAFGLKVRSGRLYKGIFGSVKNDFVGYLGIISSQKYKFEPQNFGREMVAKNNDYMKFQINGKWVTVARFTIPSHDFFQAAEHYVKSTEADMDVEKVLEKEINKISRF